MVVFGVFFIFLMTTIGAAIVFLFKKELKPDFNKIFLGFAAGVMIAASIWSLIIPALEEADELNQISFIPVTIGFVIGGLFIFSIDFIVPKFNNKKERGSKLFLAVTLHNIPEGLAVGLAFGLALNDNNQMLLMAAMSLAIGIGIQNVPEGAALALPMAQRKNKIKGFLYGTLSGIVEPIMAVIGIVLATKLIYIMPFALSFAAGAMIYVVAAEIIPEAHEGERAFLGTWGLMIGFIIMMILDVALKV